MTFISKDGKVLEGELIDIDDKQMVTLERPDGQEFKVHASTFADETLIDLTREWERMEEERLIAEEAAKAVHWKIAYFIFPTIDAKVDGKEIKAQMNDDRLRQFTKAGERMARVYKDWSGGVARVQVDTYVMEQPLRKMTALRGSAWPSARDMEPLIKEQMKGQNYDSIVVGLDGQTFRANWAGLGITSNPKRLPYGATYAVVRNPGDETFVHEWMHGSSTFMRDEHGINCPDPHENPKFGVTKQNGGWKHWYVMLMTGAVPVDGVPAAGFSKEAWELGGIYYEERMKEAARKRKES